MNLILKSEEVNYSDDLKNQLGYCQNYHSAQYYPLNYLYY